MALHITNLNQENYSTIFRFRTIQERNTMQTWKTKMISMLRIDYIHMYDTLPNLFWYRGYLITCQIGWILMSQVLRPKYLVLTSPHSLQIPLVTSSTNKPMTSQRARTSIIITFAIDLGTLKPKVNFRQCILCTPRKFSNSLKSDCHN